MQYTEEELSAVVQLRDTSTYVGRVVGRVITGLAQSHVDSQNHTLTFEQILEVTSGMDEAIDALKSARRELDAIATAVGNRRS